MRRSSKNQVDTAEPAPDDGAFQALDQMANWVRFADTKATILTAGLGVVLTMLMTNSKTVYAATQTGCIGAYVVGTLTALAATALIYTLVWLARAIRPHGTVTYGTPNRFAWPSLTDITTEALTNHVKNNDARAEAWQQVGDLSRLADRKFTACHHAVGGFTTLALFGILCVGVSTAITA